MDMDAHVLVPEKGSPQPDTAPEPAQQECTKQKVSESDPEIEITWITGETHERLLKDFSGERTGYVRARRADGPAHKGYFMPSKYAKEAEHFLKFEPRADDVWIVSYPRSGTTWTQEMVWLLANDLDYAEARRLTLNERFPFFEYNVLCHDETTREFVAMNEGFPDRQRTLLSVCAPTYDMLARSKGPRFIQTHLPFSLLSKELLSCGAKIIYVARNPKDVAVSFYHLNRTALVHGYNGDFSTYWDYFQKDLRPWTPYWSHLEEGWQLRSHPRLLFMFYEDMTKDLAATINKVATFLGKNPTPEQISGLTDHLNIANFRKNPSVNNQYSVELGVMRRDEQGFIRKGKTGGWKDYFTAELLAKADHWIEENLSRTDLRFPELASRSDSSS